MRAVKVVFADGNTITTSINGSEEEITRYYLNNVFNIGDAADPTKDNLQRAVSVQFLDKENRQCCH